MTQEIVPEWVSLLSLAIRVYRSEQHIGVREMARKVGVSQSTISRIEREYPPDANTIEKLCQWFNICPVCGRQKDGKIVVCIDIPDNVEIKQRRIRRKK
jgi:transcriptional regulator with XRE-family HTH domain